MIWWVLACFIVAVAIPLLAPLVLTMGRWQMVHPRLALTAWFGAFFGGLGLVLAGLIISAVSALAVPAEQEGLTSLTLSLCAWLGLGALGAVTALVYTATEPLVEIQRATVEHLEPASYERIKLDRYHLIRFHSDHLIACAVPLRTPTVFVSSGLHHALSEDQLRGVIAHERAHLRQFHGLALRIAHVNALALSKVRAGPALKRASLLLVELAADDAAARSVGSVAVAEALRVMGTQLTDAGMLARAQRLDA